jgi:hypothetical protein
MSGTGKEPKKGWIHLFSLAPDPEAREKKLSTAGFLGLQQRALSGIYTRFPIMSFFRDGIRTTVVKANIEDQFIKNATGKIFYSPVYHDIL